MNENRIVVLMTETILPASLVAVQNVVARIGKNVKIAFIEDGFVHSFSDLEEGPLPERILCGYNLCQEERDRPLMSVAGKDVFTTYLTDLLELLLKQPNGEPGDLLTDSSANIFYVLDNAKELCAAIAYWTELGWCLDVYAITEKSQWLVGNRVFSYKEKLV